MTDAYDTRSMIVTTTSLGPRAAHHPWFRPGGYYCAGWIYAARETGTPLVIPYRVRQSLWEKNPYSASHASREKNPYSASQRNDRNGVGSVIASRVYRIEPDVSPVLPRNRRAIGRWSRRASVQAVGSSQPNEDTAVVPPARRKYGRTVPRGKSRQYRRSPAPPSPLTVGVSDMHGDGRRGGRALLCSAR
jgi:hypothetical protein